MTVLQVSSDFLQSTSSKKVLLPVSISVGFSASLTVVCGVLSQSLQRIHGHLVESDGDRKLPNHLFTLCSWESSGIIQNYRFI